MTKMSAVSYWENDTNMTLPLIHESELQNDYQELSRFSRPLLTFAATATITIMIVGILGNSLTVVALLRCPKVRNVAAAFIISLCFADLVFCSIVLPFSAARFVQGTWSGGTTDSSGRSLISSDNEGVMGNVTLCKLVPFMRYGSVGVSLLSIAMITVNRYIMITHSGIYARVYRKRYIAAMLIGAWIFSYGFQVPTLLGVWGAFAYDPRLGTCSVTKDSRGASSKTALFVVGFVTPCIVIIACYARIFWVVHSSEVRMRQHAAKANNKPQNNGNSTTPAKSGPQIARTPESSGARMKRNEWRITKMVLAIFLSFVVCYLPITIAKVADPEVKYPGLHIMGYILLYLSACINPIIYVIMNKQYRQAYKTVLLCERPRILNFTAGGNSSAQEKSKERLACSYNHSRTFLSIVSIADPPTGVSTVQPDQTCTNQTTKDKNVT